MKPLIFILPILLWAPSALAQVENYVPPPMFDAPGMNSQPGEDAQPPAANPPPPPTKPGVPGKQADIPLPVPNADGTMPAPRIVSEGVVTGPKTMPSVPTHDVMVETTFTNEAKASAPLIERRPEMNEAPAAPKQAAAPVGSLDVPFDRASPQPPGTDLSGIAAALAADPASRLMVEAFANPVDAGENSDKRLALARALGIRRDVMALGVDSHRIDIRARGKQGKAPLERVALTVYNPQKTAD